MFLYSTFQSKEAVFSVKVDRKSASLTALAVKLDGLDEKLAALEKAVGALPGSEAAVKLIEEVKEQVNLCYQCRIYRCICSIYLCWSLLPMSDCTFLCHLLTLLSPILPACIES